jgi:transposase
MYIKVTKSGPRRYVQLVEAYRGENGQSRQRVIANLGRIEAFENGEASALIDGLQRVSGRQPSSEADEAVEFQPTRAVGDTWLLHSLWQELRFDDAFRRVLRSKRRFDAEALLRVMVFNRLCDPDSKLGVLRWLEEVVVPGVDSSTITHQQLLRTMDTLCDCREALDKVLARQLRPLIDQDLSIVFYDLTTIRAEGESTVLGDVRQFGRSKDGTIARQFMLGVVQTAEGLPIHHEVYEGNVAEAATLLPTVELIVQRFRVRRVVLVADRGLLSLDNLEALAGIETPAGPLEYIVAVPARRYADFDELLASFHADQCVDAEREVHGETVWQDRRLVVAHRPDVAARQTEARDAKIAELQAEARATFEKLDQQDAGKRRRGRKLSDGGATARFYRAVSEARLGHILKVDLTADTFNYVLDQRALDRARLLDGKLLLVTNLQDHDAEAIVDRYRSLADIERGFRVLKSDIEIAPVYHRLPERIRAHAMICFIALVLYRVLRMRLKASGQACSPTRALEMARRIQFHEVALRGQGRTCGLSSMSSEQRDLFEAIGVAKPEIAAL